MIDDVMAEDVVEHGPFGTEERGIQAWREGIETFHDAFPDFSATVEDVVTEGDTVAMRVTLRGTHEGEFMGIEPTHETFEVQNMVFTESRTERSSSNGCRSTRWGCSSNSASSPEPTNCSPGRE